MILRKYAGLFAAFYVLAFPLSEKARSQIVETNTASEETAEPEIIVSGRKLQKWRGVVKINDPKLACKTKKSSGDINIDNIRCRVLSECIRQELPKLQKAYGASKKIRKEQVKLAFKQVSSCTFPKRNMLIEQYLQSKATK